MSDDPEIKYTKSHEWVLMENNDIAIIGITDYAQSQLGNVVFVDLPEEGDSFEMEEECAVVESVKTAADIYSPFEGEVTEVNNKLSQDPSIINQDAFGLGWMFKIKISDSRGAQLMNKEKYEKFIESDDL